MRLFLSLVFLCLVHNANAAWKELPWPIVNATLPVWMPDDFDASKKYPVIIDYHGNGGQPNVEFLKSATDGKHFVLVGMTYKNAGQEAHTAQEISEELGLLNALKKRLVESLSIDPSRIYVGGFSRGGWQAGMLLDYDRTLAGGIVLGGGVFKERADKVKFQKPIPIYIGCGRNDGNYPPSIGALAYFRKMGADPMLEAWPDTGHAYPQTPPEGLRQWLLVQAGEKSLSKEAATWIEKRLAEIEAIENPVGQWFAYDEFSSLPFVKKFGEEAAKTATAKMDVLLKNSTVAIEKKWRDESRRILVKESGDRLLTTLQGASKAHHVLAEKAMGTQAGIEAQKDFERTRKLLETATVVTRPTKGEVEHITPELTPSTPSRNPDRSPFFQPGINVKPAK